jgi:hypothetical protein
VSCCTSLKLIFLKNIWQQKRKQRQRRQQRRSQQRSEHSLFLETFLKKILVSSNKIPSYRGFCPIRAFGSVYSCVASPLCLLAVFPYTARSHKASALDYIQPKALILFKKNPSFRALFLLYSGIYGIKITCIFGRYEQ